MKRGKINQVALACELADAKLMEEYNVDNLDDEKISKWDKEAEAFMYKAKPQTVFNKWYDHYWDVIEKSKE